MEKGTVQERWILRSIPTEFHSVALSLCSLASLPRSGDLAQQHQFDRRKKRQTVGSQSEPEFESTKAPPTNFDACSTAGEKYLAGDIGRPSYSWVKRPS